MKQHYSKLGKEVSERGGRTDVQHCLLHGSSLLLKVEEDGVAGACEVGIISGVS